MALIFLTESFDFNFSKKRAELVKILHGDAGYHSHSHYHHHRECRNSHSSRSSSSSSESREKLRRHRKKFTLMSQRHPRPVPYFP